MSEGKEPQGSPREETRRKPVKYGDFLHIRIDAETREKIELTLQHERRRLATSSSRLVSLSKMVRSSIDMYYRHRVLGHSFVAPDDPRYGQGEPQPREHERGLFD